MREYQSNDGDYTDPFWVAPKKKHIPISVIIALQAVNAFNDNQHLQPREDIASSEDQRIEPVEEFPYWWFIEPTN